MSGFHHMGSGGGGGSHQKVSGNVVVVCLTVIILMALGTLIWVTASGQDAPIVFAAILTLLGAAVPGVINTLQVAEVKHQATLQVAEVKQQSNDTQHLLDAVDNLTVPSPPPAPGDRRDVTGQSPGGWQTPPPPEPRR